MRNPLDALFCIADVTDRDIAAQIVFDGLEGGALLFKVAHERARGFVKRDSSIDQAAFLPAGLKQEFPNPKRPSVFAVVGKNPVSWSLSKEFG